jgi:type IV pilus assembly protein PilW
MYMKILFIDKSEWAGEGFTLVELMIAMVISGIIAFTLYSTYTVQQRSYTNQEAVAEMQQNIRAVMVSMERDIRMAGYYPAGGTFGFVNAVNFDNGSGITTPVTTNANSIAFTADMDGDGVLDRAAQDANGDGRTDMADMEQIAYRLNGFNLQRYSTTSGVISWVTIAQNIEAIEFLYLDGSGTVTTVPANIRAVRVSILARASRPDRKYTNTMVYTPASGVPWDLNGAAAGNAANDNFRRRLLITTIQCRNMGL